MRLLIFARPPIAGKTKTRLIPKYGAKGAVDLYLKSIRYIVSVAIDANVGQVEIHSSGPASHPYLRALARARNIKFVAQTPGNLGRKMRNALAACLPEAAIIVGADCVGLNSRDIRSAARMLDTHDAVFTPATDGGYVLVGLKRELPGLFVNIPWGSGQVWHKTQRVLARTSVKVGVTDPSWDLDNARDARRFNAKLRREAFPVC